MLTIFSWAVIHEIFHFVMAKKTKGCFQALAIVNLAPRKMKCINRPVFLDAFSIGKFNKATCDSFGTVIPVILRIKANILFQKLLILGHSHQVWIMERGRNFEV